MLSYLVTGASRGLGLATVTFLANDPKNIVFATARSKTPELQKLLDTASRRVIFIEMDTTNQASVREAVKGVEQRLGDDGLDVLINNAGVGGFAEGWTDKM